MWSSTEFAFSFHANFSQFKQSTIYAILEVSVVMFHNLFTNYFEFRLIYIEINSIVGNNKSITIAQLHVSMSKNYT